MADPTANEDAVLAQSALSNKDKASDSKEFFVKNAKYLLLIVGFFIKHPAKLYLGFHATHFSVLLQVLYAIHKAEPIDKQIKEVEDNIARYVDESKLLIAETKKVPSSPLADTNPVLLVLLLPALKDNPEFVNAYNANLDAYEDLVQKALESAEGGAEAAHQIESGTPPKIRDLYDELEKLSASGGIKTIIKESNTKRLQFVEFDLVTIVQQIRGALDDQVKYLRTCWEKARGADRL